MITKTLPKIPALIMSDIFQLREDLNCNAIAPYEGKKLIGDDFTDFVHDIHSRMPRVRYSTLLRSIQHLAGFVITPEVNAELSWRLAGSQHHLRKGIVVPPHTRQLFPEWVAVQVWDVERKLKPSWIGAKKDENKVLVKKVELDLRVIAGTPAGKHFKRMWPEKNFFHKEAKQTLGFSSYDKRLYDRYFDGGNNYPLKDIRQLVKLRFFVYLDPVGSKGGEIFYEEMKCTAAMKTWNRDIMQRRERQAFQCPKGYDLATIPCHKCEAGFDLCRAGCHSKTYIKKHCPKCDQQANFETPLAEWCVDCLARSA